MSVINGSSVSGHTVCVTGAGGFTASWLVKLLLERGYTVKGTVRNPEDPKNSHLRALKGAEERLVLCKADLLDYDRLRSAIHGCVGLFHTASPVTNDPRQVSAAVDGTKNVINAAAEVGVRRVVFTSSIGAMHMDPNRSHDTILDESCWSDLEFCKNTNNWYCYAKAAAERTAMELCREKGMNLSVVIPAMTTGPMLQSTINGSILQMLKYIRGSKTVYPNAVQGYVDVRDVAQAHVLVYENPSASGRHFCLESVIHRETLVRLLRELFPQYPIVARCEDELKPRVKPYGFSNKKLKDLGLHFIPIKNSLYETVRCLQEKGHLPLPRDLGRQPLHQSSL